MLIDQGILHEAELLEVLHELTELRLTDCFGWREGTYAIEPGVEFAEHVVLAPVHPIRAIFRGVSEKYDFASLFTYFGPLKERFVVATELFSVHYETLEPFLRYLEFIKLLDGKTTFMAALRSDDSHALEIVRTLYVLLVTDMIRPTVKPGEPVRVPDTQAAHSKQIAVMDYRELTAICDSVAREYLRIKESDYFDVLGLTGDVTDSAVNQAYEQFVARFSPEKLPAGVPDDIARHARAIINIATMARDALRDSEKREAYRRSRESARNKSAL